MQGHLPAIALLGAMSFVSAGAAGEVARSPVVDDQYHAVTTMRDINSLGICLEAYYRDNGKYPAVSTATELKGLFVPNYAKELAADDAWGTPIKYLTTPDGQDYRLVSAGSDRRFSEEAWDQGGVFTDSKEDAVFSGNFVRKWAIDFP